MRGFHNEVLLSSRGLWRNFIHLHGASPGSGCVRRQSLGSAPVRPLLEQGTSVPGCVCDGLSGADTGCDTSVLTGVWLEERAIGDTNVVNLPLSSLNPLGLAV